MSGTNSYVNPASNLSYVSKDFQTVYADLLSLTKEISSRWDPSISNESDPGVVLIKLNAILADKLNYNIDKNILEAFPMSLTLMGSARKIYSMLGYRMKWYQSATCSVAVRWLGTTDTSTYVTIPAFTMVTDDTSSLVYTLIGTELNSDGTYLPADIKLYYDNKDIVFYAILGTSVLYLINSETIIKANHLDSNNRIYFNTTDVAENGIFICNTADTKVYDWKRVDNLLTEKLGNKYYEFGVTDDMYSCYIEFPEDIEDLIKDGLEIIYIRTSGANGNAAIKTLTKFYSDTYLTNSNDEGVTLSTDNVSILNTTAAANGADPEGVNEAYASYKKIVGTFDTLITLRDYLNAILNSGKVSNGFVCDKTNDILCSYTIKAIINGVDTDRIYTELLDDGAAIEPIDIKLYLLQKVETTEYNLSTYNETFDLIPESQLTDIKSYIDTLKHIGQEYAKILPTTFKQAHPCMFTNRYTINARIYCKETLTTTAKTTLRSNIILNLYACLNSAEVEFGETLSIDEIGTIIKEADSIIKTVNVDSLDYTTFAKYYYSYISCPECGQPVSKILYELNSSKCPSCNTTIATWPADDAVWNAPIYDFAEVNVSTDDSIGDTCVYSASPYDTTVTYKLNELVKNNGRRYRCLANGIQGIVPYENSPVWALDEYEFDVDYATFVEKLATTDEPIGALNYGKAIQFILDSAGKWRVDGTVVNLSDYGITLITGSTEYNTGTSKGDTVLFYITKATQIRDEVFTKSILAGKTPLIEAAETNMDYNFLNPYIKTNTEIKEMSGEVDIYLSAADSYVYELNPNELLEFYAPDFFDIAEYGSYVKMEGNLHNVIAANSNTELGDDEYIVFYYRPTENAEGIYQYHAYGPGSIICPAIDIPTTLGTTNASQILPDLGTERDKWLLTQSGGHSYYEAYTAYNGTMGLDNSNNIANKLTNAVNILSSDAKKVYIKAPKLVSLGSKYYCYWILNNNSDQFVLFEAGETERILGNGEYFIYSSASLENIEILGLGTKITRSDGTYSLSLPADYSIEELLTNGLSLLSGKIYNPDDTDPLVCTKNQSIYLNDKCSVKLNPKGLGAPTEIRINADGTAKKVDDEWQIDNTILLAFEVLYNNSGETSFSNTLPDITIYEEDLEGTVKKVGWNAISILLLDLSATKGLELYKNQRINLYSIYSTDGQPTTIIEGADLGMKTVPAISTSTIRSKLYTYKYLPLKIFANTDVYSSSNSKYSLITYDENNYAVYGKVSLALHNYVSTPLQMSPLSSGTVSLSIVPDASLTTATLYNSVLCPILLAYGSYMMRLTLSSNEIGSLLMYFMAYVEETQTPTKATKTLTLGSTITGEDLEAVFINSVKCTTWTLNTAKTVVTFTNSIAAGSIVRLVSKKIEIVPNTYFRIASNETETNLRTCSNTPVKFDIPLIYDPETYQLPLYMTATITLDSAVKALSTIVTITAFNPMKYQYSSTLSTLLSEKYEALLKKFDSLEHVYNYLYEINENELISDPLAAYSYLNINHPFQKYTICAYAGDFGGLEITER